MQQSRFPAGPAGAPAFSQGASFACCAALLALSACQRESNITRLKADAVAQTTPIRARIAEDLSPRLLRRFAPIPGAPNGPDTPLVRLGRMLYFEPLLSRTGKVSCNSCHPLDRYGTTDYAVLGRRRRPSPASAMLPASTTLVTFRLFWDGRAATLAEQALGPLSNPTEMGMKRGRARSGYCRGFPAINR